MKCQQHGENDQLTVHYNFSAALQKQAVVTLIYMTVIRQGNEISTTKIPHNKGQVNVQNEDLYIQDTWKEKKHETVLQQTKPELHVSFQDFVCFKQH